MLSRTVFHLPVTSQNTFLDSTFAFLEDLGLYIELIIMYDSGIIFQCSSQLLCKE